MGDHAIIEHRQPRWHSALLFIAGFATTPFAITGWYRIGFELRPFALEMALPFLVVAAIALFLFLRTLLRSVAAGVAAGAVSWAAFLMWLFYELGSGPQIP